MLGAWLNGYMTIQADELTTAYLTLLANQNVASRLVEKKSHFKSEKPKIWGEIKAKTYNSRDSLVVTHPTTNLPACGLSTAERTGSPVLHTLWSYVLSS